MRELTYKLPATRLAKLGRSMARKAFARTWWATWLLLALYLAVLFGLVHYVRRVTDLMASIGIPSAYGFFAALAVTVVLFLLSAGIIRGFRLRVMRTRANFDNTVRLVQDDHGIRIGTDSIEFYLKWAGISQLLIEPDGVVVSHGAMFWLIPNVAFASPAERLEFISEIYGRLSDRARSISEHQIRPVLEGAEALKAA